MTGDLYINGKDAWTTWGVNMGDGFLDAIDGFLSMKDYVENESRLEHGKRVIVSNPRIASRELTLHFTLKGESQADYRDKRNAFEEELYKGVVNVRVPVLGEQVYKLIYLGKSVSYGLNRQRTFATISAKFDEPNPADRAV